MVVEAGYMMGAATRAAGKSDMYPMSGGARRRRRTLRNKRTTRRRKTFLSRKSK